MGLTAVEGRATAAVEAEAAVVEVGSLMVEALT
jgi:hypothetical protein